MEVTEDQVKAPTHQYPALLTILLLVPCLVIIAKLPASPFSAQANEIFSVADGPARMQGHMEYVLYVPLSAIVVSLFRLTLGLPVLSLFRPILTAVAFRIIGIPWG